MLNAKESPKTLIDTVKIDICNLDVEGTVIDNIIENIKDYVVEYKILKDISISKSVDTIEISNKKNKDYCNYIIEKELKDNILSIFIYQDINTKNNTKKKEISDEKEYYKSLFTVIWKSIDNVKDEIESEIKHEKMKEEMKNNKNTKSLEDNTTNFISDISIDRIYEYLMGKFDKSIKGSASFNSLSLDIEKLFKVEYRSIDDLVKIVYKLYSDYGKSGVNVYYSFIYVFEELKRKNYVLDNLFSSNSIEKNISLLKSFVESDKYVKEVIYKLNDDFINGMYDAYPNIKGKDDFILFITDIIHIFHSMYCSLYGIEVRVEVRELEEAVKCIIKNHTNVSLDDYKKIKKWADNIINDKDDKFSFQQDLLSNLGTLYVKKHEDNEWVIDKTVLALVVRYEEMMLKYDYDEKIFPTYSLLNCSKSCKCIDDYIINTKKELDKIEDLDYTDTMIDIIKSVTVIYHYIFMYEYGLDKLVKEDSISVDDILNVKKIEDNKKEEKNEKVEKPKIEKVIFDEEEDLFSDDLGLIDNDLDDDFDLLGDMDSVDENIEKIVNNMKEDIDEEVDEIEKEIEEEKELEKEESNSINSIIDSFVDDDDLDDEESIVIESKDEDVDDIVIENINYDDVLLEYDVVEEKDKYTMDIILPGLKKSDVEIDYEYNKIIISTSDVKNSKSKITDKYYGKKLVYNLVNVDEDGIDASLKNGILTIIIPKKTVVKKKITIK